MPQPSPTHIATRVEVISLLLTRFGRRSTEKRPESTLASEEGKSEVDSREIEGLRSDWGGAGEELAI